MWIGWRKHRVHFNQAVYEMADRVQNCGSIGDTLVAVARRRIAFVDRCGECAGAIVKDVHLSGFVKNAVVYVERGESIIKLMTHPYEHVRELPLHDAAPCFLCCSRHYFCIGYVQGKNRGTRIEIYRQEESRPSRPAYVCDTEEAITSAFFSGSYLVTVSRNGLKIQRLVRVRTGEGEVLMDVGGRGAQRYRFKGRTKLGIDIVRDTKHSAMFVVNKRFVVHGTKVIFDLKRGREREQRACALTPRAHALLMDTKSRHNCIHSFVRHRKRTQRLFMDALPEKHQQRVYEEYFREAAAGTLTCSRLNALLTRELVAISELGRRRREFAQMVLRIRLAVKKSRDVSRFKSVMFTKLAELCRLRDMGIESVFFMLLSPRYDVAQIYPYCVAEYDEGLLDKAKGLGYSIIREDIRLGKRKRGEREFPLDSTHRVTKYSSIRSIHYCTDFEHVHRTPGRFRNSDVLEQCKATVSGNTVGDFPFNEFDTENRRKKAFVFYSLAAVGRGALLLNANARVSILQIPRLKVYVKKNNNVVALSSLYEADEAWPSFHNAVSCTLTIPNRPFVSATHVEKFNVRTLMCLGGTIFAIGVKEHLNRRKLSATEKDKMMKSLLLSLCKSRDSLLIGSAIVGNAVILKGTGDKKLSSIIKYNLGTKNPNNILLQWSIVSLGILFCKTGDTFAEQTLLECLGRRGPIQQVPRENSKEGLRTVYYDKYFRLCCAFSLALVLLEEQKRRAPFVRMKDRTCELIVNGILFMQSGSEKACKFLEGYPRSTPYDLFYSALARGFVMYDNDYDGFIQEVEALSASALSAAQAHSLAGRMFYYGIRNIPGKKAPRKRFARKVFALLERLDENEQMPDVLFDYTLLALALALNSTGDSRVVSVCKNLLSASQKIDNLVEISDYSAYTGEYRSQYGLRYGRVMHIKMCLSLIAPGCGRYRVKKTKSSIVFLLMSFYVDRPIFPEDQSGFQMLRHLYVLSFQKIREHKSRKRRDGQVAEEVHGALQGMSLRNKKVVFDTLATYYESHPSNIFGANVLERMMYDFYFGEEG